MLKIGITGGIGSGKSVVAAILRQLGYPVYDSDSRAKQLTNTHPDIKRLLTDAFGTQIYSGNLPDRQCLSRLIFSSDRNRDIVNGIIHPIVAQDFNQWAISQKVPMVFLESAILMEFGFVHYMDKTVLVTAPVNLRIQRVQQRSHLAESEIRQRMQSQLSDEQLTPKVDFVIQNDEQHLLLPQIQKLLLYLSVL